MLWNILTYFGDSMLILPTGITLALFMLWKADNPVTALIWLIILGISGLAVSISKLLFLAWGIGSSTFNFTGFSGHTTMSATLWPVMFWLIGQRFQPDGRRLMITAGYFIAIMVGISRLALHAHSVSEVISGFILGSLCSVIFLYTQHDRNMRYFTFTPLAILLILPLSLMSFGKKAPTQQLLEHIATQITGKQPWTREEYQLMAEKPEISKSAWN
ncbi:MULTISPECIES: phosphatase PAP2 family protein [Rahnella]|uniref:phosphatase PAP2 family protein n=1 Tax=Rahnella TaxID=34037 RepID=UPI00141E044B|nr:phosphatase PAP2 family protein [Rahnella aceris]MDP9703772.1 membrane-associated phospholipid phosphatase [Rahnella aquatilis]NIA88769.1 phosphatase PAP2 family protein [Rahnella aceris]